MIQYCFHFALILCLSLLTSCAERPLFSDLKAGDELIVLTRNSPTTYYFDNDSETGFDYELIKAFADASGYKVRIKVAFTLEELIQSLAAGDAHIAAAGLTATPERLERFHASVPYLTQRPLVVYKSGLSRPRTATDLINRDIIVLAGSSHSEALARLAETLPALRWREIRAADTLELMQLVTDEKAHLAIVDSMEFRMQQRLYPRLVAGMELDDEAGMVWYLPRVPGAEALTHRINDFLKDFKASGALKALQDQHFGHIRGASRIGSLTFQQKIQRDLPKWQPLIERVAKDYRLDWRLLAAVSYQESHWNHKARSPTGVRGMMMITRATARDLGVDNRLDPEQSLRGGARFLKDLIRRLPNDIVEPDRTWMALAAYNIGMGHLEDARILTERAGLDPHRWQDVRSQLPVLQDPDVYPSTRFGFARGREAMTYVDNIRHYYAALRLRELPNNRIQPPIDMRDTLPPEHTRELPRAL